MWRYSHTERPVGELLASRLRDIRLLKAVTELAVERIHIPVACPTTTQGLNNVECEIAVDVCGSSEPLGESLVRRDL